MTSAHSISSPESAELAASYLLGHLDQTETAEFEAHLRLPCTVCQQELLSLAQVLAKLSAPEQSSASRERLERFLRSSGESGDRTEIRPGILIARSSSMTWRSSADGIDSKLLFEDAERRYATSLVRMQARASYPPHCHAGVEEVFLLEGDLSLEGITLHSGDYCRADAGTIHGMAHTERGCLFVLVASRNDEILAV